ncbi:hypothetical protein V6C59_17545 [Acinetobacter bereziniae]|uniref:hypothetical protein n=1 Tax=Acinetobacter bereziniae TaxID=106648 RepID=UPI002FDA8589
MKKLFILLSALMISTSSFAFMEIMALYRNPQISEKIPRCKGNIDCNTFVSLANSYPSLKLSIKNNYPALLEYAEQGEGKKLDDEIWLYQDRSKKILKAGKAIYAKNTNPNDKYIYARGLAVLLFIEQRNGWNTY